MKVLVILAVLFAFPASAAELFAPVSHQTLSITASEAASGPLESGSNSIRLACTVSCTVAISATNGASVVSQPTWLPADTPIYLNRPRSTVYVRAYGGTGTLFITEGDLTLR